MDRIGDGKEAIKIYAQYIGLLDQTRMIDQLLAPGSKGEVGKLRNFEFLDKFDTTVEKAAKVAGRVDPADPTRNLYGQEGWVILLNCLH